MIHASYTVGDTIPDLCVVVDLCLEREVPGDPSSPSVYRFVHLRPYTVAPIVSVPLFQVPLRLVLPQTPVSGPPPNPLRHRFHRQDCSSTHRSSASRPHHSHFHPRSRPSAVSESFGSRISLKRTRYGNFTPFVVTTSFLRVTRSLLHYYLYPHTGDLRHLIEVTTTSRGHE